VCYWVRSYRLLVELMLNTLCIEFMVGLSICAALIFSSFSANAECSHLQWHSFFVIIAANWN